MDTLLSVRKYNQYEDLPLYFMCKNPFTFNGKQSYGAILYVPTTKRWLIVERLHQNEIVQFARGSYQRSEVIYMLKELLKPNLDKIKLAITSREEFNKFYEEINGDICYETIEYSYDRIMTSKSMILNYKYEESRKSRQWGWVKGKREGLEKIETTLIREIKEETDAIFDDAVITIHPVPITTRQTHSYGNIYLNTYYFLTCNKEFEIRSNKYNSEISRKLWIETEQLRDMIPDSCYSAAMQALDLYEKDCKEGLNESGDNIESEILTFSPCSKRLISNSTKITDRSE